MSAIDTPASDRSKGILRIVIVTGIFPPDIGGPATFVSHVAQRWGEQGHDVAVVTLADDPHHPIDVGRFRVVRIPRRRSRPWRQLSTILAVLRVGRGADVLFINGLVLEASLANRALRRREVHKVVGDKAWESAVNSGRTSDPLDAFQQAPQEPAVNRLRRLRASLARRADAVIVPSWYLRSIVTGWPDTILVAYSGHALGMLARREEAERILDQLLQRRRDAYYSSVLIALCNRGLGRNEEAIEWLQRGVDERDGLCPTLRPSSLPNPLRSDPRVQALLRRMNFPEAQ